MAIGAVELGVDSPLVSADLSPLACFFIGPERHIFTTEYVYACTDLYRMSNSVYQQLSSLSQIQVNFGHS